jgi:myosin heavy subunit
MLLLYFIMQVHLKFNNIFFTVLGDVTYKINGFLDKNKDLLYPDLEELMKLCQDRFFSELFIDSKRRKFDLSKLTKIREKVSNETNYSQFTI